MDNVVELFMEISCIFIFVLGITFTIFLAKETGKLLQGADYNLYHGSSVIYEVKN